MLEHSLAVRATVELHCSFSQLCARRALRASRSSYCHMWCTWCSLPICLQGGLREASQRRLNGSDSETARTRTMHRPGNVPLRPEPRVRRACSQRVSSAASRFLGAARHAPVLLPFEETSRVQVVRPQLVDPALGFRRRTVPEAELVVDLPRPGSDRSAGSARATQRLRVPETCATG